METAHNPRTLLNIVCLTILLIVVSTILWATRQPYLGFSLEKNSSGKFIIASLENKELDKMLLQQEISYISNIDGRGFIPLPEHFSTSKIEKRKAFDKKINEITTKAWIFHIITHGPLTLKTVAGKQINFDLMQKRPLSELGNSFWLRMAFGVLAAIMGALVWSWHPTKKEHLLLFASGVSLMIMTTPSAIEGIPMFFTTERSYWVLEQLTLIGTMGFLISSALTIVFFPKRLAKARHILITAIAFSVLYTIYILFNKWDAEKSIFEQILYASSGERYFVILVGYLLILGLCVSQWLSTRLHPLEHLQAKSVTLAWLTGPTILMLFYLVPIAYLKVEPPLSRTWAWGCITLSYLMILIGVGRVKLFENERYISTIWNWFFITLLFISFDLILVLMLDVDSRISTTLIFLIVLWFYLPIRRWLYKFFSRQSGEDYQARFAKGIAILTSHSLNTVETSQQTWQLALKQVFAPVSIEWDSAIKYDTKISNSGQCLSIRSSVILSGCKLEFAHGGTRLFNKEDSMLADSMLIFFEKLYNFQSALITGQLMERRRIGRDLHDQIGHSLLTMVYAAKDDDSRMLAQDTMKRLREVIKALDQQEIFLDSLVNEITENYISTAKIIGNPASIKVTGDISCLTLNSTKYLNILSIFREILSNTIKHSDAKHISIDISLVGHRLKITHKDDGSGFDFHNENQGFGLYNIAERTQEINAEAQWIAPGNMFVFTVKLEKDK